MRKWPAFRSSCRNSIPPFSNAVRNTLGETRRASEGKGFSLSARYTVRDVPVRARAADLEANLPLQPYQPVLKGVQFAAAGQFIQIQARLNAGDNNASPILHDLTVASLFTACDVDLDGDVDTGDLNLIRAGIGQTPAANDPRDANGDTRITINDYRYCALRCTRPSCAP